MKGLATSVSIALLILLVVPACRRNHPAGRLGENYRSFTDDGVWCWFSDPRALYYEGKYSRTYAGWINSLGSIEIGYYDHRSMEIKTHILHANLEKDDHGNPCLFIDNEGKLMVFYTWHARNGPIFLAKANRAEEIDQWEPLRELYLNDSLLIPGSSNTYTYANVCQLSAENNRLYLFWRGVDFKPNVSQSEDNGQSWSPGKILVMPKRSYHDRRPYLKVASDNRDIIDFAFTDGHPRDEPFNSIYYARYKGGKLWKANGEFIADWNDLPIAPGQSDMVYDAQTTGEKAWIWDIAINRQLNPVLVYTRFPNDSSHVYYYAIWENNQWNTYRLINSGRWFPETPAQQTEPEPYYSGGIALDHINPSIVYLSRIKNGIFEIEKWETTNYGHNWKVESITRQSRSHNVRPFVVRNYPGKDSSNLLWMSIQHYVHYTDYQSSIKMNTR